jgi:hypothetical protein
MDHDTQAVRTFLASMQEVREELGEFVRQLYKRPQAKLVSLYHPNAYSCTDFGVSAELRNGAGVDFWITLELLENAWLVSYSVERRNPDEDGTHTEVEFPEREVQTAADLPLVLAQIVRELREASSKDSLFR